MLLFTTRVNTPQDLLYKGTKPKIESCHIASWIGALGCATCHILRDLWTVLRDLRPFIFLHWFPCKPLRLQGSGGIAAVLLAFLRQWMQLVHGGVRVHVELLDATWRSMAP